MRPLGTDDILVVAKTAPVTDLPSFIGRLAEATAIANMRLLAPASVPESTSPRLVDRVTAAHILGVSRYYLEGKRLPCQTRAGRKILYNEAKLKQYVMQGHVPYEDPNK
jgi:hypothetical protein